MLDKGPYVRCFHVLKQNIGSRKQLTLELQRAEARELTYVAKALLAWFNEMEPTLRIESKCLGWSNQMTPILVVPTHLISCLV